MSRMVEALCIRSCFDSREGLYYEKGKSYTIDAEAMAMAPKGTTQDELRGGAPNSLIKHFRTTSDLPPDVAARVEVAAHKPGRTAPKRRT